MEILEIGEVAVKEGLDIILDFINFFEETSPDGVKAALDFLKSDEQVKHLELAFEDGYIIYMSFFKNVKGIDYLMIVSHELGSIETYYKLNYE